MGRQIVTRADVVRTRGAPAAAGASGAAGPPATGSQERDGYTDRVVKYVPAGVVAVYLAVSALLAPRNEQWLEWTIFGFLLVMTPLYLARVAKVSRWQQLAISTVAFAVWVFAANDGGPFRYLIASPQPYAGVLALLFTFAVGVIEPAS